MSKGLVSYIYLSGSEMGPGKSEMISLCSYSTCLNRGVDTPTPTLYNVDLLVFFLVCGAQKSTR